MKPKGFHGKEGSPLRVRQRASAAVRPESRARPSSGIRTGFHEGPRVIPSSRKPVPPYSGMPGRIAVAGRWRTRIVDHPEHAHEPDHRGVTN